MPCRSGSPHSVLGGVHGFWPDAGACAPRFSVTRVPMTIASAEMIDDVLNRLPLLRMALSVVSLEQIFTARTVRRENALRTVWAMLKRTTRWLYVKESDEALNQLFRALADGTRRDILARSLTEPAVGVRSGCGLAGKAHVGRSGL